MNDQELQLALAKMLPDMILIESTHHAPYWKHGEIPMTDLEQVKDTEWLHVCWLAEKTLSSWEEISLYRNALCIASGRNPNYWMYGEPKIFPAADFVPVCCSSWQQRAEALCKIKSITQ